MKILIHLILIFIISCSFSPKKEAVISEVFPPSDNCIVLYNLNSRKFEYVSDVANCHERYPAASTFKIPLAVMAFDAGVLKDPDSGMKWDKVERMIPDWNKDHNAQSWMKDSVVWFSQRMTPKIGMKKIETYLKNFRYGNQDMSSGLKYAWLTPAPFMKEPMSNSLRISAIEQAFFLRELWIVSLPMVSKESQRLAKSLIVKEPSSQGVLRGKTGSGFIGEYSDLRIGWFVGHLKSSQAEYIVVSNFVDKQKIPGEKTFGGKQAKAMLINELKARNLW